MNIVGSCMIYRYGSFDTVEMNCVKKTFNANEEEYGHFVDIENAEPVEIIEFYLVKNMCGNGYNVCRKNTVNPNYVSSISSDESEDENDDYLMENLKNSCSHIFRCFIKQAYITFIGVTVSMMLLCNTKSHEITE